MSRGSHRLAKPARKLQFTSVLKLGAKTPLSAAADPAAPRVVRRRPTFRVAAIAAPLATAAVIGVGVAGSGVPAADRPTVVGSDLHSVQGSLTQAAGAASVTAAVVSSAERTAPISRDFSRVSTPETTGRKWTARDLNLRLKPDLNAATSGEVEAGKRIAVTGERSGGYAQVVVDAKAYWVTAQYLAAKKPETPETIGISGAACPDGSAIESALQPAAIKVYRAVCAAFPELSSYGGQDGHGEHVNGQAIDFMTPSHAVGERVKDFLYAHHSEFNLFDIIWAQRIWTIERSGEGFRSMSNRGSATANHFDHVHIKVN